MVVVAVLRLTLTLELQLGLCAGLSHTKYLRPFRLVSHAGSWKARLSVPLRPVAPVRASKSIRKGFKSARIEAYGLVVSMVSQYHKLFFLLIVSINSTPGSAQSHV